MFLLLSVIGLKVSKNKLHQHEFFSLICVAKVSDKNLKFSLKSVTPAEALCAFFSCAAKADAERPCGKWAQECGLAQQ